MNKKSLITKNYVCFDLSKCTVGWMLLRMTYGNQRSWQTAWPSWIDARRQYIIQVL